MTTLPAPSSIPSLPQEDWFKVLDTLFEPSPELHALLAPVLASQSFSSYKALIDAVGSRMAALSAADSPNDRKILYGILGSHPRLGRAPPTVTSTTEISELSKKEQAGLNMGAEEQAEKLKALNAQYEDRFPGLGFVYVSVSFCLYRRVLIMIVSTISTFVNGRSRDIIMQEMRERIARGDTEREVQHIIQVRSPFGMRFGFGSYTDPTPNRPCVISRTIVQGNCCKNKLVYTCSAIVCVF